MERMKAHEQRCGHLVVWIAVISAFCIWFSPVVYAEAHTGIEFHCQLSCNSDFETDLRRYFESNKLLNREGQAGDAHRKVVVDYLFLESTGTSKPTTHLWWAPGYNYEGVLFRSTKDIHDGCYVVDKYVSSDGVIFRAQIVLPHYSTLESKYTDCLTSIGSTPK